MEKRVLIFSVAVISVGAVACATSGTAASGTSAAASAAKTNPNLITTAEVDSSNLPDAYEIVQRLRPNWLTLTSSSVVNMGGSNARRTMSGGYSSGTGGLIVYLDNAKLGPPDVLRDISASAIGTIQYMDAATATATLIGIGSDVITGAIIVHSRVGH